MSVRLASFATLLGAALGQMIKSTVGDGINISIAIPDVDEGPFDILVKIAAPAGTGWAAVAWGGQMLNNPLSVAWPNAGGAIVSSRWATGYALPLAYNGATVTVLKSSTSSSDGWTASFICKGCSDWDGGSLDPNGDNEFAWAFSARSPFTPASVDSIFPYHTDKDHFSVDLSKAKLSEKEWDALVEELDAVAEDKDVEDKPVDADKPDDSATGDEGKPDKPVEVPEEKTSIEKPVVQTSVILPPAETDVDRTTSDRDGRIPRPTFLPIPEPGDEEKEPAEPNNPDDPDKIPRPTFLPSPSRSDDKSPPSTLETSTVRAIPRPSPMPAPDTPIQAPDQDPGRVPAPRPRPTFDDGGKGEPSRTPVPDQPLPPNPPRPPPATVTQTVIPVQPRPTVTQTVTAVGPPPWAGRGRGGARGGGRGGGVGRGRGRGRGG